MPGERDLFFVIGRLAGGLLFLHGNGARRFFRCVRIISAGICDSFAMYYIQEIVLRRGVAAQGRRLHPLLYIEVQSMFKKSLPFRVALSFAFSVALLAQWPAFAQTTTDGERILGAWKLSDIQDDSGDRSSDLDIYAFVLAFHEEQNDSLKVDVEIVTGGADSQTLGPYNGLYEMDESKDSLTVRISVSGLPVALTATYAFDGDDAMTLFMDSGQINTLMAGLRLFVPQLAGVAPYAGMLTYVFTMAREDVTSAEHANELPETATLAQNYPNPFNPATEITWRLDESGPVRLEVFDMAGRRVATLVDGVLPQGEHSARFDAAGLSTGTYAYRLTLGNGARTLTRTMTLVR